MATSKSTARRISVFMSGIFLACLLMISYLQAPAGAEEESGKSQAAYTDVKNAVPGENDNCISFKEQDRSFSLGKIFDCVNSTVTDRAYTYVTVCSNIHLSGCKAKNGIFHYKLQSDDDEDPLSV